jgi:hypothetical protein
MGRKFHKTELKMANRTKKHNTFFQWRKGQRMAPILLEVLDDVQTIDDCREVYKVRWHVMATDRVYPSVFPMMATDGGFDGFVPIPRKVYLQATMILNEAASYQSARRRILTLMKNTVGDIKK